MLDGVSLDQLRTFVAAVDEGSFSAAARKLNRVQSAVSGWVSGLEDQIGVRLFDRSGRFPKLTPQGALLLTDARSIISAVDTLKARAKLMTSGLEPELSVVVDVFFPTSAITAVVKEFAERFPHTRLKIFVEGLGAGYQPILDGRCSLGILASLPVSFPTLSIERIGEFSLVVVASVDHPLSRLSGKIPRRELAKHVQLVLTDRSELLAGKDFGVLSPSTWRLADLSTKYAFLKDGVGWGSMPWHMVEQDLVAGALATLDVEGSPKEGVKIDICAVHATDSLPGPAGQWLIDRLSCSPIY
ncbi:LysR family transcriptional regulator [Pseudomonas brassicacearum]|uniref:LysR family transcriptional regulator n=1 Tax=Pseudomonas brassicacearum TaxID=930166 RepID=UPI003CE73B01